MDVTGPTATGEPQTFWMTDEQQKAIWDFVNNGGGFLAIHNAHTLYPPNGLYYQLWWHSAAIRNRTRSASALKNKNHPITAVEDFDIYDEQHMSKYCRPGAPSAALFVLIILNRRPAGWWREMGKGRFGHLLPGHTPEALNHPMVQRLIENAARWGKHDSRRSSDQRALTACRTTKWPRSPASE